MTKTFLAYFFAMHALIAGMTGFAAWIVCDHIWPVHMEVAGVILGLIAIVVAVCIKHMYEVCMFWREL